MTGAESTSHHYGAAYLAAAGYERQLGDELARRRVGARWHGRLALTDASSRTVAWAANTWFDPVECEIASIGDAARTLRSVQRNWAMYAPVHHGRAALIADRLPYVSARPLDLDDPAPNAPLGSWTLLGPNRLVYGARCSSPFANGEIGLIEDHDAPPSRAYLKLWEALVRLGRRPQTGDRCVDLGASPGGWTWLLARLGARVVAVDKAALAAAVASMVGVETMEASAFSLEPNTIGDVDWLCSDVVAYPARLLEMVERWQTSGRARNIVCTVKFQGPTDHDVADAFAALGGTLVHLHHNKHELTYLWPTRAAR